MFEIPGSDIVQVMVEEDTARGHHPARYQYKDNIDDETEQTHIVDHSVDTSSTTPEVKTSVL